MTPSTRIARLACVAAVAFAPLAALAQNVATVNGKPVPKSRVDVLLSQAARGGQQKSPELEARAREEVVLRADLGAGKASAVAWGCDLTPDYVHINSDYTT